MGCFSFSTAVKDSACAIDVAGITRIAICSKTDFDAAILDADLTIATGVLTMATAPSPKIFVELGTNARSLASRTASSVIKAGTNANGFTHSVGISFMTNTQEIRNLASGIVNDEVVALIERKQGGTTKCVVLGAGVGMLATASDTDFTNPDSVVTLSFATPDEAMESEKELTLAGSSTTFNALVA